MISGSDFTKGRTSRRPRIDRHRPRKPGSTGFCSLLTSLLSKIAAGVNRDDGRSDRSFPFRARPGAVHLSGPGAIHRRVGMRPRRLVAFCASCPVRHADRDRDSTDFAETRCNQRLRTDDYARCAMTLQWFEHRAGTLAGRRFVNAGVWAPEMRLFHSATVRQRVCRWLFPVACVAISVVTPFREPVDAGSSAYSARSISPEKRPLPGTPRTGLEESRVPAGR